MRPRLFVVTGAAVLSLACNFDSGGLGSTTGSSMTGTTGSTSAGPTTGSGSVGDNSGTMSGSATTTGPGTTATTTGMPDTTNTESASASSSGSTGGGSSSSSSGGESSSSGGESSSSGGGSSSSGGGSSSGGMTSCTPIIVEALTALTGNDNDLEWVVLYNPCVDAYDLTPMSIAWGNDLGLEDAIDLVGTILPGDCFVVGGPTSAASNFNPVYDQAEAFSRTLDSGEGAILLHELPPMMIDIADIPVDSLIYGDNNVPGYLDPMGVAVPPMAANPSDDESMRRTGLGPTWEVGDPPTPNACPAF